MGLELENEAVASAPAPRHAVYKVVELSVVTDEEIERAINTWVAAGWLFEGIQFAMREASKRPAMAFLLFTRAAPADAT